ncbi:LysR family transcriptional regulator [Oscillibacter sp. MSJ-2]|uniref:LysR family transcriptional regulator n=1 Tax=Dysosmobacter acutus TaxID=2841504 RepID=A0ABS6FCQ1_9FIRM|nr:LysR family transcriptional regulator [Dysosmobacter acutus]MBU5627175.1 LysR family transcriptional regulator [Dysosmobacter acutus]
MSLYSWNVVAMVAEHHSITQAAHILDLTPSAVSHMIKKVEENVGYPIFIRERNRFELTSNGKTLLPYVQNYLKSGTALQEEASRLKNSVEGAVCIAAYNNVIRNWLPSILKRFHEKYPNIRITIRQSNDVRIKQWMERGEIDLAIVFNSYYNASSFIPLHKTPMVCFTPKDYFPRNGTYMTAEDLRDMPIILRTENFDEETNSILSGAAIPFDSVFRIDNDESCYEYIRQGFGFRITAAITYPRDDRINMYPIENAPFRTIGLITVFPQYISPTVNLFRKETIAFFSDNNLMNV